jgi:Rhodanase C-terminal
LAFELQSHVSVPVNVWFPCPSERASALLRYKMENDPDVKNLGIQGVYQLQGGIDKYFKEFPDGGYWKGKNYTFDKRYAHEPTATTSTNTEQRTTTTMVPMGQCESCRKPWDRYRGKRRCPTCGVPSLICKECYAADQNGTKKLDKMIRCDLCVEQKVYSKTVLREQQADALQQYQQRQREKGQLQKQKHQQSMVGCNVSSTEQQADGSLPMESSSSRGSPAAPLEATNPDQITRLYLKNMCRKRMTEEILLESFPSITHIVWNTRQGVFLGQAWVEMESPTAAANAVARSGEILLGRPLYVEYQAADSKDIWPPAKAAVR